MLPPTGSCDTGAINDDKIEASSPLISNVAYNPAEKHPPHVLHMALMHNKCLPPKASSTVGVNAWTCWWL